MDCRRFRKEIPDFLQDRLPERELREFLEHREHCSACAEELSVEYLISVGMDRLETGEAFNLRRELAEKIEEERRHLVVRSRLQAMAVVLELLALASAGALAAALLLW